MPQVKVLITLSENEKEQLVADVIDYLESARIILDDDENTRDTPFDDIKD